MFETLYKTDVPTEFERAEYYQPHLDVETVNGRAVYYVRERHGWYSETEKRAIHHTTTLNPDEGFDSFEEAEESIQGNVNTALPRASCTRSRWIL